MSAGTGTRWTAIWAVFAAGLVCGAYIGKVPPALPPLRGELQLTLLQSGFIATMFNAMGMLVGLLAGVLCDRFGHKRYALAGMALLLAGGLLGAAANGYTALLVSRFAEGVGFILFTVAAPALMSAVASTARDRGKALMLWSAYMPTGGSLALLASPLLIGAVGWRGLWVVLAAAAAVCFAFVARAVPASQRGTVRSFALVAETLPRKGNIVLALLFALYVAQWTSIMVWLPTFAVDERGASPQVAALLTAAMVIANIPGNLIGGWLNTHGVRRGRLVFFASAIGALCQVGMLTSALPDGARFALVLLFSLSAGVIPASIFAGLPVHAKTPQHIATGNGMVMQASQAGQFFGPIALAWIASRFGGWEATLGTMLVLSAAAALCGVALARIEKALPRRG